MLTLDKISNQLPYHEKSFCVFDQLGECSINREFGIVCREHANQVFGIGLMNATFVLPTGESRHHTVVATQARETFLPFPYKFKKEESKINAEEKPCLDVQKLDESIENYVGQMKITSPALIPIIKSALRSSISDGTLYDPVLPQAPYYFHLFSNQDVRSYLLKRWEDCWVVVQHTYNGDPKRDLYPVDKLPVFYQIMLMYFTMSYNVLDTASNPDATNAPQLLIPRIILNADEYCFEYCNNLDSEDILILRGDATHATPLVLAGKQIHRYNIDVFKQGINRIDSLADNYNFCPNA